MRDAYRATGTGDIQGPNRPTVTERETGTVFVFGLHSLYKLLAAIYLQSLTSAPPPPPV